MYEGDWLCAEGGGTKHFISFVEGYSIFSNVFVGVPNFMVEFWNPPPPPPPPSLQYTYLTTGP
jgi:hypothetical protein